MTQIKVTPSFLIQLMQNSRGLSDEVLMNIVDDLRKKDGILTDDDVKHLFHSEEETVVSNKGNQSKKEKSQWAQERIDYKMEVGYLLSNYLSNINQNLTDDEVYALFEKLLEIAIDQKEVNKRYMLNYLDEYLKQYSSDVSILSNKEIKEIVEKKEENEFGEKVLIENWPDAETYNVFEEEEVPKDTPPLKI